MRIISGTCKGRRLKVPNNLPIRPTTDYAKEALFNILRTRISFDQLEVLELFAGSGNISFEFASRGVGHITSVDAHEGCIKFIKKTSEDLSFPITPIKADVIQYLDTETKAYNIIFADPPYELEVSEIENIVNRVFQNELLKDEGVLIIEHIKQSDLSNLDNYLDSRNYGGCVFSFFGKKGNFYIGEDEEEEE